jgi:hypothetical protein
MIDRSRTGTQALFERIYREKETTKIKLLNFSLPLPQIKNRIILLEKDNPA